MKNILLIVLFFNLILSDCFSQNFDINLLKRINPDSISKFDSGFRFLSNSAIYIEGATPVTMIATGLFQDNKEQAKKGYVTAASLLLTATLTTSLKFTFNRKRPFIKYPELNKKADVTSPSFPSGHTSMAFATATSLSLSYPKWYVITPSFLWAGLVSYSRMYLGVHYPSDVFGGIVIGIGSAFLCYKAQDWFDL